MTSKVCVRRYIDDILCVEPPGQSMRLFKLNPGENINLKTFAFSDVRPVKFGIHTLPSDSYNKLY